MPLRGRGPILQASATGCGVATQLTRNRRRTPTQAAGDLTHPTVAGVENRDLLFAQQKTNSAPKQGQKKMGPSRHSRGTNANQPPPTHQPPHRHPRSTTHQRSLPKTAPDAHAARPADDQATASPAATHDQPYEPSLLPLQLLTLETLRRPFESTQYLSIRYINRLAEVGIEPSVGSVGDSYHNALAESVVGLYKTELIHKRAPWKDLDHLEYATLEYVDWFNHRRLLEPIGDIRPTEKEANYHQEHTPAQVAGVK